MTVLPTSLLKPNRSYRISYGVTDLVGNSRSGNVFFTTGTQSTVVNLVSNGGFEQPTIAAGTFQTLSQSNVPTAFVWSIPTNTVDVISSGVFGGSESMSEGSQRLDLVGVGATGDVEQSFATLPGVQYQLRFAYANNPFNPPPPTGATVSIVSNGTTVLSDIIFHSTSTLANQTGYATRVLSLRRAR